MINYYFKNRLVISVVFTIFAVFIAINFASNIASSIDQTASIVSNNDDIEESIILINIPQGASAAQISSILAQEGILSSSLAFEIYLRNENLGDKLRAGEYEISNKLEFEEISNILLKGPPLKTYTITIPEGLWITETIESISSQTGYDVDLLTNSLLSGNVESKYVYLGDVSKLQNWEGLLYPNTYQIALDASGEEILQILVNELEAVIDRLLVTYSTPNWINSTSELFAVASLVEAESKLEEDRPLVSSVIKNRLYDDMLLQIDAMILYALQERKSQVLLIDLQVESPYNSYKYTGLPPTPISGFGERSLIAVFDTPETDFIYYLLTDKNGKMSFTNDYTDFINMKNKAKEEGVIP